MAEDKRFPVPAAVRPAVMATPPKKVETGRANYGQVCAAVNCNTCTGTCEGLAFFTFPKNEEKYAHLIEFARYATSSNYLTEQQGESGVFGGCSPTASYVYS